MKKLLFSVVAVLSASVAFAQADKVIKVGATPKPHADLLNQVKADLQKAGFTLEVREFTDYIQPNVAVQNGDLDANFFQHLPYMEDYNDKQKSTLVNAGSIHYEPMGVYSKKIKDLKDVKDGMTVAVPNDATNEGRALLVLKEAKLIDLKSGVGLYATIKDITQNPKKLKFTELEAALLPRQLDSADVAVINGNYAINAGLTKKDALFTEGPASKYPNIVAVKKGNEKSPKILALVKALQDKKVKDYITKTYADGSVAPVM